MPQENTKSSDLGILSELLQQSRNKKDTKEVHEILDSGLTLVEKIQKIKKIDDRTRRNNSPATRLRKSMDHADRNITSEGNEQTDFATGLVTEEQAAKNKHAYREIRINQVNIKAFILPKSFFSYIFSDYRRIKQFGRKTHIFETRMFGLKLKLNQNMARHFGTLLQLKLAQPLLKILQEVLKNSWLILDKKHYNLLVLLKKHCESILSVDFIRLNFKDNNLIDRLGELERSFLVLHNSTEIPGEIIECFDLLLDKDPKTKEQMSNAVKLAKQILYKDLALPSLYNFIIGLNIVKTRSMLTLKDLVLPVRPLIYADDFDCNAQVKSAIDQYLNDLEKKLDPNLRQMEELIRTRVFLPEDEKRNLVYSHLQEFYNKERGNPETNFINDQDNMIRLTQTFARIFDQSFIQVLSGKIEVQGIGNLALFSTGLLTSDLDRLRLKENRLEKLLFILPSFPRNRYLNLKGSGKGAIPREAEAIHEIADVFSIILSISRKIATILRNRKKTFEGESKDWKPLNSLILQSDQISLPFENNIVSNPVEHAGISVLALLQNICTIGFQAAAFSFDAEIHSLLKKEKTLKEDINGLLEIYHRIGTDSAYDALRKKYNV